MPQAPQTQSTSPLQVTEILPNPEGKDGTAEFIELTNLSTEPIDLANYTLDDSENGSKPYKISQTKTAKDTNATPINTTLAPGQSIAFYKSETKISLNNTNDEARLFSPNGELLDQLQYTKTTEGKSLSKIKILSEKGEKSATLWTNPTPNQPPETFYKFEGNVPALAGTTQPLSPGASSLPFHPSSSQKTISITSKDPLPPILTSIINQNPETTLSLLTKKISNQEFELIDYKIMNVQPTQTQSTQQNSATNGNPPESATFSLLILIFTLSILLILALFALHSLKKKRKANTIAP